MLKLVFSIVVALGLGVEIKCVLVENPYFNACKAASFSFIFTITIFILLENDQSSVSGYK
jgi:hypothetical protein